MMMSHEELEAEHKATLRRAELAALSKMSFLEMEAVMKKWMLIPDPGIVKFLAALYISNRIPGKALWAFIIGPSGGGKTELLNTLSVMEDVTELSTLTPNTFLSGMPGSQDPSLLPKLRGKVVLLKDWTSMLSMQKDAKSEIMGQFREIYDGKMTKAFGTGKVRTWEGKITVAAASTQAVDLSQQQFTHLGERFLNYRPLMPDRKAVALRSIVNDSSQDKMQKEMANAMYSFLHFIDFSKFIGSESGVPQVPEQYREQIVNLANFCTMARSGVIRDIGMKKEVVFVPSAEMPTRITGQLSKLGSALIICNDGEFIEKDMDIIYKTALDSIPQTNKMVIIEMAKADNQTTAQIATALGYPTEPIKLYLENLALLKVCKRIKTGRADQWKMEPEFSEIIRHYEGIEELTSEEIAQRKEDAEMEFGSGKDEDAELDTKFNNFALPINHE